MLLSGSLNTAETAETAVRAYVALCLARRPTYTNAFENLQPNKHWYETINFAPWASWRLPIRFRIARKPDAPRFAQKAMPIQRSAVIHDRWDLFQPRRERIFMKEERLYRDVHHGLNALETNARADNRQGTKKKPTRKKKRTSCGWHG